MLSNKPKKKWGISEMPTDKRDKTTTKISMNEIVANYSSYIYNIAYKLTGKTEQAEDIAQETFIKAWKHLDELKDQTALKQWLRTICVNEFRMSLRKDNRQKIAYVDNIEELEKDGKLLVNPTEDVIEEVQASEDVISMRNGCFLAMSRKLSVNQRITISGKNEYRFFFSKPLLFF